MLNKRGVSGVVTAVLLILLVVAAILIIGAVIMKFVTRGGGGLEGSGSCVSNAFSIVDVDVDTDILTVKRETGEEKIDSFRVFVDGSLKGTFDVDTTFTVGETTNLDITLSHDLASNQKVELGAVIGDTRCKPSTSTVVP